MPERKFGKVVVLAGLGGAVIAVGLAFVLPEGRTEGQRKRKAEAGPATTPRPPVRVRGTPADIQEAQLLAFRARKAETPEEQLELTGKAIERADIEEAYVVRADALAKLGRPEEALQAYAEAAKCSSYPVGVRLMRAELAAKMGRHAEAAADFAEVLKLQPSTEYRVKRGVQLVLAKDFGAALAELDDACRQEPSAHDAAGCRGAALALSGRWQEGLAAVEEGMKAETVQAPVLLGQACAHAKRGLQLAEEIGSSTEEPRAEAVRELAMRASYGSALKFLGPKHELVPAVRKLVEELEARAADVAKRKPALGLATQMGTELAARASSGGPYAAVSDKMFQAAMAYDGQNAMPHVLRGLLLFRTTCDPQRVREELRTAEKLAPDRPEVRGLRGLVRLMLTLRAVASETTAAGAPPLSDGDEDAPWVKGLMSACRDLQEYVSHGSGEDVGLIDKMVGDFRFTLEQAKGHEAVRAGLSERLAAMSAGEQAKCLDCSIGLASRALQWGEHAGAYRQRGRANFAASRFAEAAKDWEKAAGLDAGLKGELEPLIAEARKRGQ